MILPTDLTENQLNSIQRWQAGQQLAQLTAQQGWDRVLEIFSGYRNKLANSLIETNPGETDLIIKRHMGVWAANEHLNLMLEEIAELISFYQSRTIDQVVQDSSDSQLAFDLSI